MERYTIDNLPDGTMEKHLKRAEKKGFLYMNGTTNLAAYIRDMFIKEANKK